MTEYKAGDRVVLNDKANLAGPEGSPNGILRANRAAIGTVTYVVPTHTNHLFVKFDGVEFFDPEAALANAFAVEASEVDPYRAVDVSEFEKEF